MELCVFSQLVKGGDVSKTLDMKGREAAVKLVDVSAHSHFLFTIDSFLVRQFSFKGIAKKHVRYGSILFKKKVKFCRK